MRRLEATLIWRHVTLIISSVTAVFLVLAGAQISVSASGDSWGDVYGVTVSTSTRLQVNAAAWHGHVKDCSVQHIVLEVAASIQETDACVSEKAGVGVAVVRYLYTQDSASDVRYALKMPHDNRYHLILDILGGYTQFELSDTGALTLYVGFAARLMQVNDLSTLFDPYIIETGETTSVKVYTTSGNFESSFRDDNRVIFGSGAFGLSNNGKYVALHVYSDDIGVASTETRKLRYIARDGVDSTQWNGLKLASSNDGRSVVAVTADGTFAKIYAVRDGCGWGTQGVPKSTEKCYDIDFSGALEESPVLAGQTIYDVSFNEDNSILIRSYIEEGSGTVYESVIRPDPNAKRLHYLALGDSYSSGEGDVTDKGAYYLSGTKEPGQCHLSSRSYPFVLRGWWQVDVSMMGSVACSGAQILLDYVQQPTGYRGQDGRLGDFSPQKIAQEKSAALISKKPGIVPQIEFVKKYQPSVVTLTGGGNDVGFGDVLQYCASNASIGPIPIADTCSYAQDGSFTQRVLLQSIDNQYRAMTQLVGEIQTASPRTKIYIIGYPQFVSTNALCSLNTALLNTQERQMVRAMTTRLNAVLSRAAADSNVAFVDIENSLEGGQLCQGSEYVSGLHDNGLIKAYRGVTNEMFHPNASGHSKMAHAIFQQVPSVESYIATPARQDAESGEKYLTTPSAKKVQAMDTTVNPNSSQTIDMIDVTLQPGSPAIVNVFSEPTYLGTFMADDDGRLTAEVSLPDSITPGYHTLVIEGTSISGDPITLYQFITVTSGMKDDMDGDGISDEYDRCNFISEWIDEATGVDVCKSIEEIEQVVDTADLEKSTSKSDDKQQPLIRHPALRAQNTPFLSSIETSGAGVVITEAPKNDTIEGSKARMANTMQNKPIDWIIGVAVAGAFIVIVIIKIVARRKDA